VDKFGQMREAWDQLRSSQNTHRNQSRGCRHKRNRP
jgi:hypothetical protein